MEILAVDTETTGTRFHHGDRAFLVTACNDDGDLLWWKFPVDPATRHVTYDKEILDDLKSVLASYNEIVFHNAIFDLTALSYMGIHFPNCVNDHTYVFDKEENELIQDLDCIIHDTLPASHVLMSSTSHRLKDLGLMCLDIPNTDEKLLKECVKSARRAARKITVNGGREYFLSDNTSCDYWLPDTLVNDPDILDVCHNTVTPNVLEKWSDVCRDYALCDVERTMQLHLLFQSGLRKEDLQLQYFKELQIIPVVLKMQERGVTLKHERLLSLLDQYEEHTKILEGSLVELTENPKFNIRSAVQLQGLLYEKLKLPIMRRTKLNDSPATDANTLNELLSAIKDTDGMHPDISRCAIQCLETVLDYRKADTARKYLINYQDRMLAESIPSFRGTEYPPAFILHPNFKPWGTNTTRFSSSDPNAQNVSKGKDLEEGGKDFTLREVFGPTDGRVWYSMDYKQLQLRIFAYVSKDPELIEAFNRGYDFHDFVARRIFDVEEPTENERRVAKNINFGIIFGAGSDRIESMTKMPGAYKMFRSQFPRVDTYMSRVMSYVRTHGCVYTLGGYRLEVPKELPYVGVNYIVQGTEGEIVKSAMIETSKYLNTYRHRHDGHLVMQVHDELIFDFADRCSRLGKNYLDYAACQIRRLMEKAGDDIGVQTPVSVSRITDNWANAKEVEIVG